MRWNFRQNKIDRNRDGEPTYKNPLYTKSSWQGYVIARFGTFGWLTVLMVLLIAYAIFYSPIFAITDIQVDGTSRTTAQSIGERFITWQMAQRKWLVFRQSNLLLFSSSWLEDNLHTQYSLADVTIMKTLPHTLRVTITEKSPALVWVTNDSYYYIDENGGISSHIDNPDVAGDLPQIFDETNASVQATSSFLSTEKINFIRDLQTQLNSLNSLTIQSYSMPDRLSWHLNVKTEAGYEIYFDTTVSLDSQIIKLREVLDTKAKTDPPKEYIDLTIGDRVYLK